MTTEQFEEKQAAMSNEELLGFCKEQISKLAETYGKSHTMSIPPQITDIDMLLCELVKRFEKTTRFTGFYDDDIKPIFIGDTLESIHGYWMDEETLEKLSDGVNKKIEPTDTGGPSFESDSSRM